MTYFPSYTLQNAEPFLIVTVSVTVMAVAMEWNESLCAVDFKRVTRLGTWLITVLTNNLKMGPILW